MVQTPSKAIATSNSTEIDKTFKLLEEGEKNIVLREEYKDITLILGNTGSGKSTIIQWLAGDNSKLISKEVGEDTGEFIIEDGNRIGSSSVNSKTTFPELVVDNRTNAAYYDCPGFSDTRSTSHDISATYFIKKLTDYATNVKIMLTVSYPSVCKGGNRHDFKNLLKHVTDLIKNIKNFEDSIAIGITKVDNDPEKIGDTFIPIPNEIIIQNIGELIQEIKQELVVTLKNPDMSNEDKIFYNKAIELLNILLIQKNKVYTRIGIFRQPEESGPLSDMVLFQEGKKHIEKIIHEEIKFTKKINSDFGYTISEKSKNDINSLTEKINDVVWNDMSEIVNKIINYYGNLIKDMQQMITSVVDNTEIVHITKTESETFLTTNKLNMDNRVIARLLTEIKNITSIEELGNKLNITIANLGINNCSENIKNIMFQGKIFNFLQTVSGKKINTRSWLDLFQKINKFVIDSDNNIKKSAFQAAEKVNSVIINLSKYITNEIKTHYVNKMEMLEIEVLLIELNEGSTFMSNLMQQIKNVRSAQELSKKITYNMINNLATSFAIQTNTLRILYYGKYLDFLKVLNNKVVDAWTSESINSFNNTARYLSESKIWYNFLNSLNARLSDIDIQRNKIKYNVANLNDWGYQNKPQGIEIDKDNFNLFLEKIKTFEKIEWDDVKNIEITALQLKELNNVLDKTIKNKLDIQCPKPGELLIKGDYIKFSDLVDAYGNLVDFCREGIVITSVDIFSANTIYIDSNFTSSGSQVSIAAPKWQIIGRRTINLDGASGAAYRSNAMSSHSYGAQGSHGKPGLPGAAGGNFLGIGKEFINIKKLTITTNGGQGGKGQTGGDGGPGQDGESAKIRRFYQRATKQKYYGKPGTAGGNGGDGGAGGFGGTNGIIKILKMNESSDLPSMKSISGSVGTAGRGGIGGRGGKYGDNIKTFLCEGQIFIFYTSEGYCNEKEQHNFTPNFDVRPIVELNDRRADSGLNGTSGHNTQEQKQPEMPKKLKNMFYFVNNYKKYILENLANRYKRNSLIQFISELDTNSNIKESCDTLGLIAEFQNLEESARFHRLNTYVDILPFYQSLLTRISEYAQRPQEFESSDQFKRVLINLYTATLSKISTLKTLKKYSEPNLIIDLDNYLNMVIENIKRLANLQEKNNKVEVINEYKNSYKFNIGRKIQDAQDIIKVQIEPEIDNIGFQIEHKISLLVNETITLKKGFKKEEEKFIKKKQELQNTLITSWILTGIKVVGQVVGCIGGLATAVGEVISTSNQVAETLRLSNRDQRIKTQQLSAVVISNIKSNIQSIRKMKEEKFTKFNFQLEDIYNKVNIHKELNDTSEKIKNIMTKCQEAQKSFNVRKIKELKEELKQELTRKENSLRKLKINVGKKNAGAVAIEVLGKINQGIQFGMVGMNIYNKYKNDKETLEAIDESIKAVNNKIQKIEQDEDKIYETMIPMLKTSEDELKNIISQLDNKSQVTLDLTQWQVKSFLKDINLQMRQLTHGFSREDDLSRCIEKLEETMFSLINVYDRIQKYQEQQQLSAYIADISSPIANNIGITNQTLSNAVQKLEIIVKSNLVLEQYKIVTNALTQQVFPFAHLYLNETMLPSHFQFEENFQNLVNKAVHGVNQIKTKITEYKTAVENHDGYISSGLFDSDHVSTQPFFVWENHRHNDEISKILSGKKVLLRANILNSPFDKDAIKFNVIGINFHSKDSKITSRIREKLNAFAVSITHLGNSYYRYNNNIYIFTSNRQKIEYSFEKENGEPVHTNNVYKKIKSGDLMLSPYAMWEIQLINATTKVNFNDLMEYRNQVDLELVGSGSYVSTRANIPSIHIENYYNAAETISVISDSIQHEPLPTSTKHLSNKPAHRQRKRRQLLDVPSSTARPTSWMTSFRRGFSGILPSFPRPLLPSRPQLSRSLSLCSPEFTTEHLHGGLQLLSLIVRKWTKQKYPQLPPISNLDYAEMCVQAAETVETLKETHVTSDDFERYQALLANKPLPGYSYPPILQY